jgi:hypothetical protein
LAISRTMKLIESPFSILEGIILGETEYFSAPKKPCGTKSHSMETVLSIGSEYKSLCFGLGRIIGVALFLWNSQALVCVDEVGLVVNVSRTARIHEFGYAMSGGSCQYGLCTQDIDTVAEIRGKTTNNIWGSRMEYARCTALPQRLGATQS